MAEQLALFDAEAQEHEHLSKRRKLTERASNDIAAGRHPLMRGLRLAKNDETCGSCAHLFSVGFHTRSYLKCELRGDSRSDATDCRRWWPACTAWVAK